MAYFELNCKIEIGEKFILRGVHKIEIKKTLYSLLETCTIELPTFVIQRDNGDRNPIRRKFAGLLTRGQKVSVEIGYRPKIKKEFEGYIKEVQENDVLVITCQGFCFELTNKEVLPISWKHTTLKDVLEHITKDTNVVPEERLWELKIDKFKILPHTRAADVLQYIKEHFLLSTYLKGNRLFAGVMGKEYGTTKYRLGHNTVSNSSLKWQELDVDLKVNIEIDDHKENRKQYTEADVSPNSKKVVKLKASSSIIDNKGLLKDLANSEQTKRTWTGYIGSFETMLMPYIEPGFVAKIENSIYPEQNGNYYITAVSTTFGVDGCRRNVEIGYKVSN